MNKTPHKNELQAIHVICRIPLSLSPFHLINLNMNTFLEILKYTIPGLLVFVTAYFLLKTYLDKQHQLKLLELQKDNKKASVPLKLQAYERLSLLCERSSLQNLTLRLKTRESTVSSLRLAMLIALQQEYEHNVTQQIYVSEQLWEILKLAREETVNIIEAVAEPLDPQAPADELAQRLIAFSQQSEKQPMDTALQAIKKEAGMLL